MKLNQPYYIEPRSNNGHIDLNGTWSLCYTDEALDDISALKWQYNTDLPKSIYRSLHEAGVLPDPYFSTNSKEYHWVDEKVWYYKKSFFVGKKSKNKTALLCFDGIAYYCRLWVNGLSCGEHEGMFGGPVCDITDKLIFGGKNEIVVEVKACNYGCKDTFEYQNNVEGKNTQLVPWNIVRDGYTSNGDMIVLGIWNRVRLELLDQCHISRPYLSTQSVTKDLAKLHLEMEIADGSVQELHEYYGYTDNWHSYTRAYDTGITGATKKRTVKIVTEICESDTEKTVYHSEDIEPLLDHENLRMNPKYHELQYFSKDIEIKNPRLWYPHGMGEQFLYDVKILLYDGDKRCDEQTFQTGIRTFTSARTHGRKYRHRWENFLFSINEKEFFLKGINWMPIDFLYDIDPKEYEWCLTLAKNSGVQLLRVWNGGGMPETDTFYNLCDKLGIMVWQDLMLANTDHSQSYSQSLLESQIAYNLYRIRNHTSLVLLCGGNEFNPYAEDNAAAMFVQTRVCRDLAPHILYHYTTSDRGSAHMYKDIEPVWFRHAYRDLPFLAESGIHSFPSFSTWKKLLSEEELSTPLPDLTSTEFQENFPGLLNHFSEYIPSRVPRLLARASQIVNLNGVTLENLCEASQVQAYEYYTLMLQSMRENFPRCGGVMPWVFKRHWTTAGIQVVDGTGQAGIPYYAIQNGYRQIQISWQMPWSVIAPHETLDMKLSVLNDSDTSLAGGFARLTVYRPDMTIEEEIICRVTDGQKEYSLGVFTPSSSFTDKCFIVSADLILNDTTVAQSTYFVKCTSALADKELYEKYRSAPAGNLYFENGPWLKPCIQNANQANLSVDLIACGNTGNYLYYDICIENLSDISAYPVTVHLKKDSVRHFESNNFFLLRPKTKRTVRITTDDRSVRNIGDIEISAWNAKTVNI